LQVQVLSPLHRTSAVGRYRRQHGKVSEEIGVSEEREAEPGRERPRTAADRRARRSDATPDSTGETRRGTAVRDGGRSGKTSLPSRFVRFLREVVAELRKVIWPTRNQLVTYTIVVLVFVSFMVALVSLLDYLFGRGVLFLFGT
jgi:preprotein translocase subunit SecE